MKKIIIGCPDRDNRDMLGMMFKLNGWQVITCPSLLAIVNMASQAKPDVVLIEPWENGSLVNCRQSMNALMFYSPLVVLLTVEAAPEQLKETRSFGADAHFIAPNDVRAGLPDLIGRLPARDKAPWAS